MAERKQSALKRQRQEEKRRLRNRSAKSRIKTVVRSAREYALDSDEKTAQKAREASKLLDKAASKGIIHKNTAARKKSRLARHVNKYIDKS